MDAITTSRPTVAQATGGLPAGFAPASAADVKATQNLARDIDTHAANGTPDRPVFVPGTADYRGVPTGGQNYFSSGAWKYRNDVTVDAATGRQVWQQGNAVTTLPDGTLVHVATNPDKFQNGRRQSPMSGVAADDGSLIPDPMTVTVVHPDGTGYETSFRQGMASKNPPVSNLQAKLQQVQQIEDNRHATQNG